MSHLRPRVLNRILPKNLSFSLFVAAVSVIAAIAAAAIPASTKDDVVVPFEELKFGQPKPYGTSKEFSAMALWSDPATNRVTAVGRITKGSAPKHYHKNYDMQVVLLKGTMIHWTKSSPETSKRPLGAGSYWFQPANEVHQNTCLSEECLIFGTVYGRIEDVEVKE